MSLSLFISLLLNGFKYFYLMLVILFLKYSYQMQTTCTLLSGVKSLIIPCKQLNDSIWPIDSALTSATNLGCRWPENDGNKGELQIPWSSRAKASPSCAV